MRICFLQSRDAADGPFSHGVDPPVKPEDVAEGHDVTSVILNKATATSTLMALINQKPSFDIFVNLCDGSWDEDRAGIEVVQLLERLNIPFTGANAKFYDPTREEMKKVAISYGCSTPAWAMIRSMADVHRTDQLVYPLIVKHPNSYGSIGLTPASRVVDKTSLLTQLQIMLDTYGGAMVEEFIEGREFTVLVAQGSGPGGPPVSYIPVECSFPPGESFKHFNLKWIDYEGMVWKPVEDPDLDARLRDMACKVFAGLNGVGFGRIDVRSDVAGSCLQFLEINPNCGIFYPKGQYGSADIILDLDPTTSQKLFLEHLIDCALKDHERRQPLYESVYRKDKGFGLFALRNFAEGDVVQVNEEKPTVMVSAQHVKKNFRGSLLDDFNRYAWPMGTDAFVTWSSEPNEWKPINHSCDPNTWLDGGLNTVARRGILRGEELTIDYATFCVNSAPFDCFCGSPICRGRITGDDWSTPALLERYNGHFSVYVQSLHAQR